MSLSIFLTVNGKFGEWGEFGPCSVSCGDGTKTRERSCDNPLPKYGGANCQGESKETKPCNDKPCPGNYFGGGGGGNIYAL